MWTSVLAAKSFYFRCAAFWPWRGANERASPLWGCDRGATKPGPRWVPRCFRWNAEWRRFLLAERGFEGSRGLQPADWSANGRRRGATIDESPPFDGLFKRRSATRSPHTPPSVGFGPRLP